MTEKKNNKKLTTLGNFVFTRTYARRKKCGNLETFPETVDRVLKACESQLKVVFEEGEKELARDLFLGLKCSVGGRFLWQLGTSTVDKCGLSSLMNCAATVIDEPIRPFTWAFDLLMLGAGVGYNLQLKHVYSLPVVKPVTLVHERSDDADFIVPDSREGWVKLLEELLRAHFETGRSFSYSTKLIRGAGAPIKGFGGVASGDVALVDGIGKINEVINSRAGLKMRPVDCLDVMNLIGSIVVSGNVRRSAQIAIGDTIDDQYLESKRWDLFTLPPHRAMSNNSVACDDTKSLPKKFWEGYLGNGEPFGLINLKLCQKMGRLGEVRKDNCVSINPCVSGDTELLTPRGYVKIADVVGQEIAIWNGHEFSHLVPYQTSSMSPLYAVKFSDGRTVKMTSNHTLILHDKARKQLTDIKPGDKLARHFLPAIQGELSLEDAYERGLYSAEGSAGHNEIWLYDKKQALINYLPGRLAPLTDRRSIYYTRQKGLDKNYVPDERICVEDRLKWFAGLVDGDGHLTRDSIQITSIKESFLKDVQRMLSLLGVQAKLRLSTKAGMRYIKTKDYWCQNLYRLTVSATNACQLRELGLVLHNHDLGKIKPNRDASRFVCVESIESSGADATFCFTDVKNNSGLFNGVYLGNCSEQPLAKYETCCLSEIFLPNVESKEELWSCAKVLYKICKHSLLLDSHLVETKEIVRKNLRMGIGVTGWAQATSTQLGWLSDTYERLRAYDASYSKERNINESIRLTTVKPSGTLSIVGGTTAGIHPAFARFYIRRVRISSNNPLVNVLKEANYAVEFARDLNNEPKRDTVVVEFPERFPDDTLLAKDTTAIKQLEMIKFAQTVWSDNAVSCTVYYSLDELDDIKKWLNTNYKDNIKSVSFFLRKDHGFVQAPLEEISEEVYTAMKDRLKPLEFHGVENDSIEESFECVGGTCPVK